MQNWSSLRFYGTVLTSALMLIAMVVLLVNLSTSHVISPVVAVNAGFAISFAGVCALSRADGGKFVFAPLEPPVMLATLWVTLNLGLVAVALSG